MSGKFMRYNSVEKLDGMVLGLIVPVQPNISKTVQKEITEWLQGSTV